MSEKLTITEAVKLTGIPETTIRYRINEGELNRYENKKNKICVDKRELLSLIPTVLTIFNQKGGCGKTTLSVLLADYYERKKVKSLLIDLDPQSSLSKTFFTYKELEESLSLYNFITSGTDLGKIVRNKSDHIGIIPSNLRLSSEKNYDIPEIDEMSESFYNLFKKYQIVIIDCPPGVNYLSKLGLVMANYLLMPFIPEPYNYDGIIEALKTKNRHKKYMSRFKDFLIVISDHEQRKISVQEEYVTKIKGDVSENVLTNSIPHFVGIKERGDSGTSIFNMFTEKDNSLSKIKKVLDELDNHIYEKRNF